MSNCNHDCGSCSSTCNERTSPQSFLAKPNPHSKIKKIIGIVSGKGGVGKSSITALCAVMLRRKGYRVGIIDADITGPSIPNMFNIHAKAYGSADGILPQVSKTGIEVMSMNLLLDSEKESVIYRGPVIAGIVNQFYTDVIWKDIDFLFVDMPPGTGDVPLTVFQSYPVDGIIIVSTPQQLVSMIVSKACDMASKMNIPVLGLIENMSYVKCPDCGKKLDIFKNSHLDEIANEYGLSILAKLPLMSELMEAADNGSIEDVEINNLSDAINEIELLLNSSETEEVIAIPTLDSQVNPHFGKALTFALYTIKNHEVIKKEIVESEMGGHSVLPLFLKQHNTDVVVCQGLGDHAREGLNKQGIQVINGAAGAIDDVINEYIMGNLVDDPNVTCSHDECSSDKSSSCSHCQH